MDAMLAHNWPYEGMLILLQRVTSPSRRVQANALTTSSPGRRLEPRRASSSCKGCWGRNLQRTIALFRIVRYSGIQNYDSLSHCQVMQCFNNVGSSSQLLSRPGPSRHCTMVSTADMELGHILWRSDPETQFYNEFHMSKKYSQAKESLIITGKSKGSLHGLTSSDFSPTTDTWQRLLSFQHFKRTFCILGIFRKPEKLWSHTGSKWWPGRERWPKWPTKLVPCLVHGR